jgi:hypothetical protein
VTSDLDFLPIIEAVRRMGKHVTVLGYKDDASKGREFEYIPDKFVDIGRPWMSKGYVLDQTKLRRPTTRKVGVFTVDPVEKKVSLKDTDRDRSIKRIKEFSGQVAAEVIGLAGEASVVAGGITVNAGKVAALQKAAQELEAAAQAFLAVEKNSRED